MSWLRSALFQPLFYLWMLGLGLAFMPLALAGSPKLKHLPPLWTKGILWLLKYICGITYKLEGAEHLPQGAAIYASKHQSAWETFAFWQLIDQPAFVLKRELLALPIFGQYLKLAGCVPISRGAGREAIAQLLSGAKTMLEQGRPVVIFPEGTRRPAIAPPHYRSGIQALYEAFPDVPLVPIVLDSGLHWARRSFLKKPGVITVRVLPPMPKGLERDVFMQELQTRMETMMDELLAAKGVQRHQPAEQ